MLWSGHAGSSRGHIVKHDKLVDAIRRRSNAIQTHVVEEYLAGHVDRRALLRHGAVAGLALPLLGGLAGLAPATARAAKPGATIRIAAYEPTAAIDPVKISDNGGLLLLQQTGEFLALSGPDLVLRPVLAESWSSNEDGSIWTFKIRPGVKFHNGKALTAADVVASIERLADPANGSNALSVFKGVLSKGGTRKIDEYRVEFRLDAPHGNFPYYVSSDNYNAIILPAEYDGGFEANFVGTGPFKLEKYTPKVGASFLRNEDYWGRKALPARIEFSFYTDLPPQILAFQGRQVDIVNSFSVQGGQALLKDPQTHVIAVRSSAHRQLHLRNDSGAFRDKRVRRALALSLERDKLVKGLFAGLAVPGNDSPFAPVFPSSDKSVPQRHRDLREAKQLLEAAGVANGFSATLTALRFNEIESYAVLVQNAAKRLGITLDLKVETADAYYGKAVFGQSDWLDSVIGITDYGHRGVPDVLLAAPLKSDGTWNAARFKNPAYDRLVDQYAATVDLQTQRGLAGQIQRLLLDETPIVFAYFYDQLTATAKALGGVQTTATGQLFLKDAGFA
jgi:peptide/nickel transport system substrate-binding protein